MKKKRLKLGKEDSLSRKCIAELPSIDEFTMRENAE
jgi:hypothetical protein